MLADERHGRLLVAHQDKGHPSPALPGQLKQGIHDILVVAVGSVVVPAVQLVKFVKDQDALFCLVHLLQQLCRGLAHILGLHIVFGDHHDVPLFQQPIACQPLPVALDQGVLADPGGAGDDQVQVDRLPGKFRSALLAEAFQRQRVLGGRFPALCLSDRDNHTVEIFFQFTVAVGVPHLADQLFLFHFFHLHSGSESLFKTSFSIVVHFLLQFFAQGVKGRLVVVEISVQKRVEFFTEFPALILAGAVTQKVDQHPGIFRTFCRRHFQPVEQRGAVQEPARLVYADTVAPDKPGAHRFL